MQLRRVPVLGQRARRRRLFWVRCPRALDQGRFLTEHSQLPSDGLTLEVINLYELPTRDLGTFDVVLFHGLLYHLPDPITGLKIAADHCAELIVVNTATKSGMPDGYLAVAEESTTALLSGTHGLNWLPTGPAVITRMLRWIGFVETRVLWWHQETGDGWGRLEMVASKRDGILG